MCFKLTWCLTPPCIEILFFNKTKQELTQPDTLNSFLEQSDVQVLPRPALSPDLNAIEHLWDYLQRRLDCQDHQPQNAEDLEHSLRRHWNAIPRHFLQTLVSSMGRRCAAVLEAQGGAHTLLAGACL
ncbi:transposable element Tcb1 transposase [Elysia marginata]|uniref:Transposable element Tcb1 transposase n=1 Tax=Elysia marginata TaxID=1093978 RepID=A0AAV4JJF3_9GAST|nr:transposable element Tcb1 transposase [Elysia marginata]